MSISGALSNALSGLTAAARASAVASSNISNATNEDYAARELQLSSRTLGAGGVSIDGVTRRVDPQLLADRRAADARSEASGVRATFVERLGAAIGEPGEKGSLTDRMATLESALTSAVSRPDSRARLQTVVDAAEGVARKVNAVSDSIQAARERADAAIATEVASVNRSLERVADLNERVLTARGAGRDTSALLDRRQAVIDDLSQSVPVRVLERGSGAVALVSEGGATLLDGSAATLGFRESPTIVAEMTGEPPYGVSLNGRESMGNALSGGKLEALFTKRDTLAVENQARVDALAADFIKRLEAAEAGTSETGLFTDAGNPFDGAKVAGLAGRLAVNEAVDPQSGELWRLRAGLGASDEGAAGDRSHLQALSDALAERSAMPEFGPVRRSAAGQAGELVSLAGSDRQSAQADLGFHQARAESLRSQELENGVDTDRQLQRLLTIERAYAANARVMQTADDMLQRLLEI